jgi:hypothetical protein
MRQGRDLEKLVSAQYPRQTVDRAVLEQIKEAAFLYDSSLMASDDAYEILLNNQPTGVVELPIEWILDDHSYFGRSAMAH